MSINSHDGKRPSVAELQSFVRGRVKLQFHSVDGTSFEGVFKWFDQDAFNHLDQAQCSGLWTGRRQELSETVLYLLNSESG
ncbi:MAG TPA: hypothetical protein PKD05_04820 [Candidatus Melainabacteria bacterium]|nr:hypothetical protein [Candidatus Melainabacteria bacterium]